ncbi:hypothetical protein LCGC14_2006190 [marine sediment metagenome]|uniref:Uncharacterized protein n=1 Tax=marine sediment metagenome TaxID=412755 RepID=A0A0F9F1R5_9ZZZZ
MLKIVIFIVLAILMLFAIVIGIDTIYWGIQAEKGLPINCP